MDSAKNVLSNISHLAQRQIPEAQIKTYIEDTLVNQIANLGFESKVKQGSYGSDIALTRNWVQLDNVYRSNWIGRRIINLPADDMTREWRKIKSQSNPKDIEKVEQYEKKLFVKSKFNEAIKWSRLYGGSLVVMGFGDQSDMNTPLNVKEIKENGLKSLTVFSRWQITPGGTRVNDLSSPEFGLPEYYIINGIIIHHSRCIRFISDKLPWRQEYLEQFWGCSTLENVFQALLRYDTTSDSAADLVFIATQRYFAIEGYRDAVASGKQARMVASFQELANAASYNRIMLFDKKDEFGKYEYHFEGLPKIMELQMLDVCGAAETPVTKIFGREPAGLSSTGDGEIRNYYDDIRTKQENKLRYPLQKLDAALVPSAIGNIPPDWDFDFPSLWQLTDEENAKKVLAEAQADTLYVTMGALTEIDISKDLQQRGHYQNISVPKLLTAPEDKPEPGQKKPDDKEE